MIDYCIQNWGVVLAGGLLCLIVIDTVIVCLGRNETTVADTEFAKWLRKPVLEKTIITTNSDGSEIVQKVYRKREGDGERWGISGIC